MVSNDVASQKTEYLHATFHQFELQSSNYTMREEHYIGLQSSTTRMLLLEDDSGMSDPMVAHWSHIAYCQRHVAS